MPGFWEHPTVSMGLGPINAIFQARFDRYLHNRGIKDTSQQHTWAFLGDGEMDEPESRGAIHVAAAEGLDNLTFVINCNLQRLDGPVHGNGKVIQELESFFRGAGWNVIKVIWGREWDRLLHADRDGALINLMNTTPDGDFQTYKANDGAYVREHFFGRDPRTKELVKDLSDADVWNLKRGAHDYRKVYAAYQAAMEHQGRPTVILAKSIKGYTLGPTFEGRNATHQMKKLTLDDLKTFRDEVRGADHRRRARARPVPAAVLPPRRRRPRDRVHARPAPPARRPAARSAGTHAKPLVLPGDKVYDVVAPRLGQAGDRHDDGVRPPGQGAHPRRRDRQARRPDHPGRGAHVRDGLVLLEPQDLQPAGPALHVGRPRPAARLPRVRGRASCCTRASTRPARWPRSPRSARRTPRTASR